MSFCVDLWNGFDDIKEKFRNTHRQIKYFNRMLNEYITLEKEYCKNLDNLYKEFKDIGIGNFDFPLEKSRLNIVNMIDFESKQRKEFIKCINKIIEKIGKYLSEPKISLDNHFFESSELTLLFNKSLSKLITKQESFHLQCKELSSYLSQIELENDVDEKTSQMKTQKIYNKVIKSREEYLFYINETNIEREKYNLKTEELLNELEKVYRKTIDKFKGYLYEYSTGHYNFIKSLYEKDEYNYDNFHSKIDLEQESSLFMMRNATKQFPMIKIEFCPLKLNAVTRFIKSKYHDKLSDKDFRKCIDSIKAYFKSHDIFPDNLIQSGISKITIKKNYDFFFNIGFTKTKEEEKERTPEEKEAITMNNVKFIKNALNEIITNNTIEIFEDKITNENIFKLDKKDSMTIDEKKNELSKLIDKSEESCQVYIETLIKTLSFIRSKGLFEIDGITFDYLKNIFKIILGQNPKNDYILKNILILAQTFYKIENYEKIYLQEGIKGNEVLNSSETWHRCINYSLNLANTDKDLTISLRKEDLISKIEKEAFMTVISYLCDLKQFTDDEKVYKDVKNFYVSVYKLDENTVNQSVEDYMKDLIKKKEKEKEELKNKKNKENKNGVTKEDKKSKTKNNKEITPKNKK